MTIAPVARGAEVALDISNYAFVPGTITINVGDSVTWQNSDPIAHTTTSGSSGVPNGTWDSGLLNPSGGFTRTFSTAGSYDYFCGVHSFMTGKIIVQPAAGAPITNPIPAKIAKGNITIELQTVVTNLVSPLGVTVPDDGSGRMFLYDQVGLIHVVQDGAKLETPLLDVQNRLVALGAGYDERGLLGVAAHPNFAAHPFVYTYTSEPTAGPADFPIPVVAPKTNNHQSVIAEWKIDPANTNRLDPASRRELLRLDKPQSNHNGGTLRFGPDGFLYFTVGDGGAADDQGDGHVAGGNAQDTSRILGKISRIDVDARTSANGQYGVPQDNPFVGQSGVAQEIFAYGLRNPYSFSFDRETGELYLADVGQNNVEEVDKIVKGGNFGWPIKEGTFFFDPNGTGNGFVTTVPVREVPPDLVEPIAEYDHDEGLAIISGYAYHGTALPALTGKYVFGDWGTFSAPAGRLFYLDGSTIKELQIGSDNRALGLWLKGYGQDAAGELYIMASTNSGPSGSSGRMMKLIALPQFQITGAVRNDTTLTLTWTGGTAPFVVQMKSDAGATVWTDVKTVSTPTADVPIQGDAGFIRIQSAGP